MADSNFGVVTLEFEGQTYKARLDFNAMCDFEDRRGAGAASRLLESMESEDAQIDVVAVRLLFWCALVQFHPEITEKEAGSILFANKEAFARVTAAAMPQSGDVPADASKQEGAAAPGKRTAAA